MREETDEDIETTSDDISQDAEASVQMGLPDGWWRQADLQIIYRVDSGQQSQAIGAAITELWYQSKTKLVGSALISKL